MTQSHSSDLDNNTDDLCAGTWSGTLKIWYHLLILIQAVTVLLSLPEFLDGYLCLQFI